MSVNLGVAPAQSPIKPVRKTIAFDGTAGNGAVGTVTVFTIAGRVFVHKFGAFCTESLAEAAPTASITCGTTSQVTGFFANPTGGATDLALNDWWGAAAAATVPGLSSAGLNATSGATGSAQDKWCSENIILTIGTQNVTNGTLIFDIWYEPVTDGATLS